MEAPVLGKLFLCRSCAGRIAALMGFPAQADLDQARAEADVLAAQLREARKKLRAKTYTLTGDELHELVAKE